MPYKESPEKLDILLVNLPPWGVDVPPLGTACLKTYLDSQGIKADIFDLSIALYNQVPSQSQHLWSMNHSRQWRQAHTFKEIYDSCKEYLEPLLERIVHCPAKIIGFSLPTDCSDLLVNEIVRRVKQHDPSKVIVLGGVSVSIKRQRKELFRIVEDNVDYIVVGEGEEALLGLVKAILKDEKEAIGALKGVITHERFLDDVAPVFVESLENLPYPRFDAFNLDLYKGHGKGVVMEFSRGCVGNCPFCDFKTISPRFRSKSPQYILEQIKFYVQTYGVEHISICDAAVNGNIKVLDQVCDLLIQNNSTVQISALAIPRKEMTKALLAKMRKAGFYRLEYGVESGSNKVLKAMRKVFTKEIAQEVISDSYDAGFMTLVYLIVGFPGETQDDLNETKDFLKNVAGSITLIKSINPLYIMAGSEIFYNYKKYGIVFLSKDSDMNWYIPFEDNTRASRGKRVKEIKLCVKKLGIAFTEEADCIEFTEAHLDRTAASSIFDFILVNLPPWGQANPHIGIGYLSEYLREKDIVFKVLDFNKSFFLNNPRYHQLWHVENKSFWHQPHTFPLIKDIFEQDIQRAVDEIIILKPKAIGFSVVDPKQRLAIELIKRIKEKLPSVKIILGGPATSTDYQRQIFLDNVNDEVDAFVIGEGELILAELLEKILNGKDIVSVAGCYVKSNGQWIYKESKPIEPLEILPFPTYEEFNMSSYAPKSLLVEWSRGCKGKCAFCKNYRLFPSFRLKSPQWISDELRYHIARYGINEFTVTDNEMGGCAEHLKEICDCIIQNNICSIWSGQIAPHKDMDVAFFKKLKKAGCSVLQIGLESGSDVVLKCMRKPFTAATSQQNIRDAHIAGIKTEIFIMVGFPGENEQEFRKTYDFIKRNRKYIDVIKSINTLHLIPGTEVYEKGATLFNMMPLPDNDNWYYLWQTYDGNDYPTRKRRAEKLLALAKQLNIEVKETNIHEGKSGIFDKIAATKDYNDKKSILECAIAQLQVLPGAPSRRKCERSLQKWLLLFLVFLYTFFYIVYFWFYMKIKGRALLGAK